MYNLRRKGKDLIPNRNFSTMRMIRNRTFPSKDESTNGGRGHQTTKKRKKSRRNGVDAGTSSALTRLRLTPRFRHFFGVVMEIWKNAVASIKRRRSVPGPLAKKITKQLGIYSHHSLMVVVERRQTGCFTK